MLSWPSLPLLKILSTRMNNFSLKESIGGKFLGVREERGGGGLHFNGLCCVFMYLLLTLENY